MHEGFSKTNQSNEIHGKSSSTHILMFPKPIGLRILISPVRASNASSSMKTPSNTLLSTSSTCLKLAPSKPSHLTCKSKFNCHKKLAIPPTTWSLWKIRVTYFRSASSILMYKYVDFLRWQGREVMSLKKKEKRKSGNIMKGTGYN